MLKYLIETSVVIAAIGHSTAEHNAHVNAELKNSRLFTSVYVRNEFIRRFICDFIEIAVNVDMYDRPSEALLILAEEFGRKSKIGINVVAWLLGSGGKIVNDSNLSAEVCDLVVDFIEDFDGSLSLLPSNKCGCERGKYKFEIDYNSGPVRQLYEMRKGFLKDVIACKVNDFLDKNNPAGRMASILDRPEIVEKEKLKNTLQLPLLRIKNDQNEITCSSCCKIGDPIIALDQPGNTCLVHLDRSFNALCTITGREHKLISGRLKFKHRDSGDASDGEIAEE